MAARGLHLLKTKREREKKAWFNSIIRLFISFYFFLFFRFSCNKKIKKNLFAKKKRKKREEERERENWGSHTKYYQPNLLPHGDLNITRALPLSTLELWPTLESTPPILSRLRRPAIAINTRKRLCSTEKKIYLD